MKIPSYLTYGLFWLKTAERAVKTFAQAAIAVGSGDGLGLLDIDWTGTASVAALAAVISVLTSIGYPAAVLPGVDGASEDGESGASRELYNPPEN